MRAFTKSRKLIPRVHLRKGINQEFGINRYILLLLLSGFSRVRLCATPQMAAHQAHPSLGFSRQEHRSGLPLPSPMHGSEVTQLCLTLSNPVDCSLPGSSIHGICQARVLEWVAIVFSLRNVYSDLLVTFNFFFFVFLLFYIFQT